MGFGGAAILGSLWGNRAHDDVMIRFGEYGRGVGGSMLLFSLMH